MNAVIFFKPSASCIPAASLTSSHNVADGAPSSPSVRMFVDFGGVLVAYCNAIDADVFEGKSHRRFAVSKLFLVAILGRRVE
jgi:hypothetical protein